MFLGHFRHAVDAKGRVAVPSTFRRDLAQGAVLTVGQEGRLVIWPQPAWQEYVARYSMVHDSGPEQRQYMRILYSQSREVELDAQGRVLLSDEHRRFAGITDRAVFVGMNDCFEIVGEAAWDAEQTGVDPDFFTSLGDRIARPGAST
jgi:MraZ protein